MAQEDTLLLLYATCVARNSHSGTRDNYTNVKISNTYKHTFRLRATALLVQMLIYLTCINDDQPRCVLNTQGMTRACNGRTVCQSLRAILLWSTDRIHIKAFFRRSNAFPITPAHTKHRSSNGPRRSSTGGAAISHRAAIQTTIFRVNWSWRQWNVWKRTKSGTGLGRGEGEKMSVYT